MKSRRVHRSEKFVTVKRTAYDIYLGHRGACKAPQASVYLISGLYWGSAFDLRRFCVSGQSLASLCHPPNHIKCLFERSIVLVRACSPPANPAASPPPCHMFSSIMLGPENDWTLKVPPTLVGLLNTWILEMDQNVSAGKADWTASLSFASS